MAQSIRDVGVFKTFSAAFGYWHESTGTRVYTNIQQIRIVQATFLRGNYNKDEDGETQEYADDGYQNVPWLGFFITFAW